MSKTIKIYFECRATSEYGDAPDFAVCEFNDELVRQIECLTKLARENGLDQVKKCFVGPISWNIEDDLRLRGDRLVVDQFGFFFSAYPKYGGYDVETESWDMNDFRKVWEIAKNGDIIYHGDNPAALEECVSEFLAKIND